MKRCYFYENRKKQREGFQFLEMNEFFWLFARALKREGGQVVGQVSSQIVMFYDISHERARRKHICEISHVKISARFPENFPPPKVASHKIR